MTTKAIRWDLGVRGLLPAWRALFTRQHLERDIVAGVTVAFVAIPLSLAIALASGVDPAVGLVTAIVAGVVCALFGGTPLAVSGPAAAMAVLVATIVQEQGVRALLLVGIGCGLLQLATGVFRLGRFVKLVPLPVIEGFTAGIGAIILIGQLPRALGLPAPEQSRVLDVVWHVADLLGRTRPSAVGVTALTLAIIYGLPRVSRRLPPHLVAVAIASLAVATLGLDTPTIGAIPRGLPSPRLPALPDELALGKLAFTTLVVYALASLETLLSATAVDKLARGPKSDPDQELVGQGVGNVVTALFGGIPVTGVIARSATNVQAGAQTRRAAIIHAVVLALAVVFAGPLIGAIPIAALAGVLFSVAFRMLGPRTLGYLWRHARPDAIVYVLTFLVIVFVDLLEGVQWGVVAALVIAAVRLGRTKVLVTGERVGDNYVFTLDGPLTFLSSLSVENLRSELDLLEPGRGVVIDAARVSLVDSSGAELLAGLVEHARTRGLRPVVVGLSDDAASKVRAAAGEPELSAALVATEREAAERLGIEPADADTRLRMGVDRFRASLRPRYAGLFSRLADGQAPHTLFITCSDSRVHPNLITATDPGELFLVRDIGNLVPASGSERRSAVAAAVEYAVGVLHVKKIIVCGHSGCGAIKALLDPPPELAELHALEAWLEATNVRAFLRTLPSALGPDDVARLNVLAQIDNLRSYDVVAGALARGALSLSAWFFDVGAGEVLQWSPDERRFVPVGASVAPPRARPRTAREGAEPVSPPSIPKPSPA